MKYKKIMLIALVLLAVLTIGAVSATEDIASDDGLAASDDVTVIADGDDNDLDPVDDETGEGDGNEEEEEYNPIYIYDEAYVNSTIGSVYLDYNASGRIVVNDENNEYLNETLSDWNIDDRSDDGEGYYYYINSARFNPPLEADNYELTVTYFDDDDNQVYTNTGEIELVNRVSYQLYGGVVIEIAALPVSLQSNDALVSIRALRNATDLVCVLLVGDEDSFPFEKILDGLYYDDEEGSDYCWFKIMPSDFEGIHGGDYSLELRFYPNDGSSFEHNATVTVVNEDEDEETGEGEGKIDYQIDGVGEVYINDGDNVIFSLVCPNEATGKFLVEVSQDVGNDNPNFIKNYERPINETDWNNPINFTVGNLGITETGHYSLLLYHLWDDEGQPGEGNQIGDFGVDAIDSTQFRITDTWDEADVNCLAYGIPVFGLYCPDGHEGLVNVTVVYNGEDEVFSGSRNLTEKDENGIIYWSINDLNLTFIGKYSIHVNVNEDDYEKEWNIYFNVPIIFSEDSNIGAIADYHRVLATVEIPSDIDEGRIIVEVDGEMVFNKTLADFENAGETSDYYYKFHPSYGPGPGDERFYHYSICNDIIENAEAKTYNLSVAIMLEGRSVTGNGTVTLKDANVAEKDGVSIELFDVESYVMGSDDDFAYFSVPEGSEGSFIVTSGEKTLWNGNLDELDTEGDRFFILRVQNLEIDEPGDYEITVAYWQDVEKIVENTATYNFREDDGEGDDADDGVVIWVVNGYDKEFDLENDDDLDAAFVFVSVRNDLDGNIVIKVWDDEDDEVYFFNETLGDIANKELDPDYDDFTMYGISLNNLTDYNDFVNYGRFAIAFVNEDGEVDCREYDIDFDEGIVKFWEVDEEDDKGEYLDTIRFVDGNIVTNDVIIYIPKSTLPEDIDDEFDVFVEFGEDDEFNYAFRVSELNSTDEDYVIKVLDLFDSDVGESLGCNVIVQFYRGGEKAYYACPEDDEEGITIHTSPFIRDNAYLLDDSFVISFRGFEDVDDEFNITISQEGSEDIVKTFKISELKNLYDAEDEDDDGAFYEIHLSDLEITETGEYFIAVNFTKNGEEFAYNGGYVNVDKLYVGTFEGDEFDSIDQLVFNIRVPEELNGFVRIYVDDESVGGNISFSDLGYSTFIPADGRLIILNDLNITESDEHHVKLQVYTEDGVLLTEREIDISVRVGENRVEFRDNGYGHEVCDVIEFTISTPLSNEQCYNIYFNGKNAGNFTAKNGVVISDEFVNDFLGAKLIKPGNYDVNVKFFDGKNETDFYTGSFSINSLNVTSDKKIYLSEVEDVIIAFKLDKILPYYRLDAYYGTDRGYQGSDAHGVFNPYFADQMHELYHDGVVSFNVAWFIGEPDNHNYRLELGFNYIYVTYRPENGGSGVRLGDIVVIYVIEPKLTVSVSNSTEGEAAFVEVTATDIFTGDVLVEIDGENYTVNVNEGYGNTTVPDLVAGNYTAVARFANAHFSDVGYETTDFTVGEKIPTEITVQNVTLDMKVGDEADPGVSLVPVDAGELDYRSSDVSVVTVDGDGTFVAVGDGSAVVTILFSGKGKYAAAENKTVTVTVTKISTEITVQNVTLDMKVGDEADPGVSLAPADAGELDYRSSDVSVVTVDGDGTFVAVGDGTAIVTILFGGNDKYAAAENKTVAVTVNKIATSIALDKTTLELEVGANGTIVATTTPAGLVVTYTSSNPAVATVDNGTVTAVSEGSAIITVSYAGDAKYAAAENKTVAVGVGKIPTVITVNPTTLDLNVGGNATIAVTTTPEGLEVIYTSSDSSIVTVNNGVVSAVAPGSAVITVSYAGDDKYAAAENKTVAVTVAKIPTAIAVDTTTLDLNIGDNATIAVTTTPEGLEVIYTSSDSSIVTVNNGVVSAVASGSAIITVSYAGDAKYAAAENKTVAVTVAKIAPAPGDNTTIPVDNANTTNTKVPVYTIDLPDDATGNFTVRIDKKPYQTVEVVKGKASISVSALPAGNHEVTLEYSGDAKYAPIVKNTTSTVIVDPVVVPGKSAVLYTGKYSVIVKGKDGKVASGVKVAFYISGKYIAKAWTDKNGVASFNIPYTIKPGKVFKIRATSALGASAVKKVAYKPILYLKAVKIKKSTKKLVLTAAFKKVNGKYYVGKKVLFRFAGFKFYGEITKKGVAQVVVSKKALNFAKTKKSVKYSATFLKDTAKRTAKVK